jgi:hypothetical protein
MPPREDSFSEPEDDDQPQRSVDLCGMPDAEGNVEPYQEDEALPTMLARLTAEQMQHFVRMAANDLWSSVVWIDEINGLDNDEFVSDDASGELDLSDLLERTRARQEDGFVSPSAEHMTTLLIDVLSQYLRQPSVELAVLLAHASEHAELVCDLEATWFPTKHRQWLQQASR